MKNVLRRLVNINLVISALVMIGIEASTAMYIKEHRGLVETTMNPFPDRAIFRRIASGFVECVLIIFYFRRRTVGFGPARLLAGMIGGWGLVMLSIMPWLLADIYGFPISIPAILLKGYVFASHLLYAIYGGNDGKTIFIIKL